MPKCTLIKYEREMTYKIKYTDVARVLSKFIYQVKIEFIDNTVSNNSCLERE